MFNFQKEVVLNNIKSATVVKPGGDQKHGVPAIDKKLRFHDGGEYFAKYIVDGKIYRTLPIEGKNFKVVINPTDAILGEHIQICLELGLDNDYRGDYGSALYYFRKPLLIDVVLPMPKEAVAGETPDEKTARENANKAAAAKVIYDAFMAVVPKEYKFVNIKELADGDTSVTIEGADSYQKVRSVSIQKYICDDRCGNGSEEPLELDEASKKEIADITKNNVEFGTYAYLLHNLRLPTYENLRFTSPSAPEMPIQGVAYAQYSFAYCVPRGVHFGGVSVAGQTNHSTTLHTFFVPVTKNGDVYVGNDEFEKLFKDENEGLGMQDPIVPIGRDGKHKITVLPDAYASSQDLAAASNIEANREVIKEVHSDNEKAQKLK